MCYRLRQEEARCYSPNSAATSDDRDIFRTIMRRYAARYYLTGSDRETVTALAEEPETLLEQPVEKAIAKTMHRLYLGNTKLLGGDISAANGKGPA